MKETQLFLVPTPIGNLQDITLRAIEVLKTVDLILAEDTRKTGILLKHHQISNHLKSYHIFNEHKVVENIITMVHEGKTVALVSDAGTPAISDPGFLLVREAVKAGIKSECLPGATALIPALVNSGMPTDAFLFEGFLPNKKGRQKKLEQLKDEQRTMAFYESPHRLIKTLTQFCEYFGVERQISVSRELTKIHEENVRGSLAEVLNHFSEKPVKGEIVITVSGKGKTSNE